MTKIVSRFSLAVVVLASPIVAHADLTFNASVVSEYRYRGISQTHWKPAVQAGVDFSDGGLYLGAWASTIRWIKNSGGDAPSEFDFYGGYKGEISPGLGYDVGVLRYQYPSAGLSISPNTTEVYGGLSMGMFSAKYFRSATNLFGFDRSRGSSYLDLSATLDLDKGMTLTPHIGYQIVRNNSTYSYADYALTLTKDIRGLLFSLTWLGTDSHAYTAADGRNLGRGRLVVGTKINF
ncbi:TorF family putative porin [Giesbergeria giesbergeri]